MSDRRIVRRMPWRQVPLRRGSDKIQAWLTLAVVVAALMAAPWAAWWTASTTYGAGARASEWEVKHRHRVAAVLLREAATARPAAGGARPGPEYVAVPAQWTGPDGAVRSGTVPAGVGTRAGTTVTVWIDEHGALSSPPRQRNPALHASVAAAFAMGAVIALLGGLRRIAVWCLDRGRLRSWEAEWLTVGPRWSRR